MERSFIASDGTHLVYDDLGSPDAPPLVLCHGLAAAARQFADDADYFSQRGFRVLVPDLRGHGRSATPVPLNPAALSLPRLAADMHHMLDHAGCTKVHWVGNSLGGIVALAMLGQGRLASLATFGTTYAIRLPRIGGHRAIALGHRLLGSANLALLTAQRTTRDPAARRLIASILRDTRYEVVTMLAGVLTHYDLIDAALSANIDILLLRGGRDGLVNLGLRETLLAMRRHPRFRLVELPQGGHCANLDAREAFRAAVLAFLAGVSPAPVR